MVSVRHVGLMIRVGTGVDKITAGMFFLRHEEKERNGHITRKFRQREKYLWGIKVKAHPIYCYRKFLSPTHSPFVPSPFICPRSEVCTTAPTNTHKREC